MSTTAIPDRFTTLPDEPALQATVVALEEHGFSVEVVDDLHAPGIQSGRTGRPRHHRDVGAVATSRQRRAEAGDAASDNKDPGHGRPTMRLVSATSRFSCCTRSSTVGNAMSGCKYRAKRSSSRCW